MQNGSLEEGLKSLGGNVGAEIEDKNQGSTFDGGNDDYDARTERENQGDFKRRGRRADMPNLAAMFKPMGQTVSTGINDNTLAEAEAALSALLEVENKKSKLDVKILAVSKQEVGALYSSIVVSYNAAALNKVFYTVLMLSGTGRRELTASDILRAIPRTQQEARISKKSSREIEREIAFPFQSFDDIYYQPAVEKKLERLWNLRQNQELIYVDTISAPSTVEFMNESKDGKKPSVEAIYYFKALYDAVTLMDNTITSADGAVDLTFTPIIDAREYGARLLANVHVGGDNKMIREDLVVELKLKLGETGKTDSINESAQEIPLIKTGLYLTPIYDARVTRDRDGGRDIETNKVLPIVTISNIEAVNNTLNYVLGGVVSATIMLKDTMYPYGILKSPNNWGALIAYENGDADYSAIGDFKSPKFTSDEVLAVADMLLAKDSKGYGEALLAIDLPHSSLSLGISMLRDCTSPDSQTRAHAGKAVVRALSEMTNGYFPKEFPANEIFAQWTTTPLGYIEGVKNIPLSNLDLTKVIEAEPKVKVEQVLTFNMSEFNDDEIDAYLEKLEAAEAIGWGEAVITDKATRAIFSANFINELEIALDASGLKIHCDPLVNKRATSKFTKVGLGYGRFNGGFAESSSGISGSGKRFNYSGIAKKRWYN